MAAGVGVGGWDRGAGFNLGINVGYFVTRVFRPSLELSFVRATELGFSPSKATLVALEPRLALRFPGKFRVNGPELALGSGIGRLSDDGTSWSWASSASLAYAWVWPEFAVLLGPRVDHARTQISGGNTLTYVGLMLTFDFAARSSFRIPDELSE
jgi:hypothetical protein